MRTTLLTACLALGATTASASTTVNVYATQDAMIFGTSAGADTGKASGMGPAMFAGADASSNRKRSLVTFDLSAAGIPSGAVVDTVTMTLIVGQIAGSGPEDMGGDYPDRTIRVYHLTTGWNEGPAGSPTSAGIGGTGQGYTIATGDTSWHYTSYSGSTWTTLGGDYTSTEIANSTISGPFTVGMACTWSSTGMRDDVRNWLTTPSGYHGWLIKSDLETSATSFLGFWTKDGATANSNPALRPKLTITYH